MVIGEELGGIPVDRVGAGYPADNSLIQKHREDQALVFGACALIHLARAVDEKIAQTTVFVTVAGDGVPASVNLEVSLDKTVGEILRQFGLSDETSRVVVGGFHARCNDHRPGQYPRYSPNSGNLGYAGSVQGLQLYLYRLRQVQ